MNNATPREGQLSNKISFGLPVVPASLTGLRVLDATANAVALSRKGQYLGIFSTGLRSVTEYDKANERERKRG